jgi:hypothetical protein
VEVLERLALLTTYAWPIAGFYGTINLDSSDTTRHTACGFPGMIFSVQVTVPTNAHQNYRK